MDDKTILKIIGVIVGLILFFFGDTLDASGVGAVLGLPTDAIGILLVLFSLGFL